MDHTWKMYGSSGLLYTGSDIQNLGMPWLTCQSVSRKRFKLQNQGMSYSKCQFDSNQDHW